MWNALTRSKIPLAFDVLASVQGAKLVVKSGGSRGTKCLKLVSWSVMRSSLKSTCQPPQRHNLNCQLFEQKTRREIFSSTRFGVMPEVAIFKQRTAIYRQGVGAQFIAPALRH